MIFYNEKIISFQKTRDFVCVPRIFHVFFFYISERPKMEVLNQRGSVPYTYQCNSFEEK